MAVVIGVDPGLHGGIAILNGERKSKIVALDAPPLAQNKSGKSVVDFGVIRESLKKVLYSFRQDAWAVIEHTHAFPNQGGVSNFTSGYNYGRWIEMLAGMRLPVIEMPAAQWRSSVLSEQELAAFSKSTITQGAKRKLTPKEKTLIRTMRKQASVKRSLELYPSAQAMIKGLEDEGKAEALLIAHVGRSIMHKPWRVTCV